MTATVLITGTSTGQACVERLARGGWTVFAGVRRREDGELLAERVPGDVRPLLLDVSDQAQIRDAVDHVADAVAGRGLDGLVNNAGIGVAGPVERVPMADWRRQFEVNLFGVVALTQAAFDLVRTGGGRFVYIGSQNGRVSTPGLAPYAASKHALEAVCESMRHELVATPMEVCLIEPGQIRTPIWDKGVKQVRQIEDWLAGLEHRDYDFLVPLMRGAIQEGATKGTEPDRVARAVEHALTAKRPRARHLVGADAKVMGGLASRLPEPLRHRMLDAAYRRFARIGAAAGPGLDVTGTNLDSREGRLSP